MILLKDGVKYIPYEYTDEKELAQMVIEHHKEIFGADTLYFDPQTMKTQTGVATRSDGIIISTDKTRWYILEVELAQHPVDEHITPQIMRFNRAYRQSETRKKITDAIFALIKQDPYKTAIFQTQKVEDIYKYLNEIIDNPPIIAIVIDQKTPELEAICKDLKFETRTTEFRTYTRENAGMNVHIHQFETFYEKPPIPKILESILTVLEQVYRKEKTYDEAIKIAAKKLNLNESTVRAYCTRDIHLTATQFRKLIQNKEKTMKAITQKFPNHESAIKEQLS